MRAFVVLAVIISTGFAAPTDISAEHIDDIELQRTKKSSYGAPCAGAAPFAPISLYLGPSPVAGHAYREDEHLEEHKARSYDASLAGLATSPYGLSAAGAVPVASGYGASGLALASHGPAVGVFPHANVGGCNVPILLSCSPSIVSGHLAAGSSYGGAVSAYGGAVPAYRSIEDAWTEEWAQAQAKAASHHKVSEDYPETRPDPHPGNHHVVSQDYPKTSSDNSQQNEKSGKN